MLVGRWHHQKRQAQVCQGQDKEQGGRLAGRRQERRRAGDEQAGGNGRGQPAVDGMDDIRTMGRIAADIDAVLLQASGNGIIAWVMRSETLGLMTLSCLSFRGIRAVSPFFSCSFGIRGPTRSYPVKIWSCYHRSLSVLPARTTEHPEGGEGWTLPMLSFSANDDRDVPGSER
ncbi:hypothetical protein CSOJ01_04939 [Colletotrichum sojae]|uniref:Uncharacterized protein n=1 Tax=Colletotrichum sojae TaxID=2175907 RepID=A0A8H6JHQ1_9PEZI|nr:hypothetical protein CSOJ01_04939 [Colletotrichum sojae]